MGDWLTIAADLASIGGFVLAVVVILAPRLRREASKPAQGQEVPKQPSSGQRRVIHSRNSKQASIVFSVCWAVIEGSIGVVGGWLTWHSIATAASIGNIVLAVSIGLWAGLFLFGGIWLSVYAVKSINGEFVYDPDYDFTGWRDRNKQPR